MDGTENATINTTEPVDEQKEQKPTEPSAEELLARIAEAEARAAKAESERDRIKVSFDKTSKELAEKKRETLANMTADEQQKAQIDEQIKALTERAEAAERENNHNKAVAAYKSLSDEKAVEQLIEAVDNSDHVSIAAIIAAEVQRAVKAAQAEWMKSRPPVNAGDAYSSMTKEEILAIKDSSERVKAIAAHPELDW